MPLHPWRAPGTLPLILRCSLKVFAALGAGVHSSRHAAVTQGWQLVNTGTFCTESVDSSSLSRLNPEAFGSRLMENKRQVSLGRVSLKVSGLTGWWVSDLAGRQ